MKRQILIIVACIQTILFGILYFSPLLKVTKIECIYFNSGSCPEEINAELQKISGKHILFLRTHELRNRLLQAIPEAEKIDMKSVLPQTVQIIFLRDDPLVNLQVATNSAALILGRHSRVVDQKTVPDGTLPSVIYPQAATIRVGDLVNDPIINFITQTLSEVHQRQRVKNVYVLGPQEIIFELEGGKKVIMSSLNSATRQVSTLQLILSEDTMSNDFTVIDIRFEKPVLKRS